MQGGSHERDRYLGIPRIESQTTGPQTIRWTQVILNKRAKLLSSKIQVPNKNHKYPGPSIYKSKKQNTIFGGVFEILSHIPKMVEKCRKKLLYLKLI